LNEPTWIIDGFNELIVDLLFALVIFLDSTQPWSLKSSKYILHTKYTKYTWRRRSTWRRRRCEEV